MTYTRLGRDTHPAPHSGLNLNDPPPQPNPIWRALNRASYINSSTRSPLRPRAVSRLSGATTTTTSTASTTRRTWSPSPVRTLKRRPGSRTISISSSTFSSPFPQLGQPRASSPAPSPPPSTRRRRPKSKGYDDEDEYDGDDDIDRLAFPKFGGGVDAFRSGEKRIGGLDDGEDTWEVSADGSVRIIVKRGGRWGTKRGRWNRFKWALFVANTVLALYSIAGLIICLLTWFNVWNDAELIRTGNRSELVLCTLFSILSLLTSILGYAGILLNSRPFLVIYNILLWVTFILLAAPGYVAYKRRNFNLEGKLNSQWSRDLGALGRLKIQNRLQCCGWFSPFIEATVSQMCYSRSQLPGCKLRYMKFERRALKKWYIAVFSMVPVHVGIIIAGLLCSNHVTYRFGKGMMPKAYRLSMQSVAIIMDNYAMQLAQQFGKDVASSIVERSKSIGTLKLDVNVQPGWGSGDRDSLLISPVSTYRQSQYYTPR